jgi:UDP-N-acetylglucosamine:LPS N-acetylglucosamine transferase
LFISGSFGLGHAIRDLAIANYLRTIDPTVEIVWLASDPATRAIQQAGEVLHSRCDEVEDRNTAWERRFSNEAPVPDVGQAEQDKKRDDFSLFCSIMEHERYDLIVGDETRSIWFHLHDMAKPLDIPFVMIHDFVGLGYQSFGRRFKNLVQGVRSVGEQQARDHLRLRHARNGVIYIGELDGIPDERMGFLLPNRRRYAQKHYEIVGYVLPFDPAEMLSREQMKRKLGYGNEPLVFCTIGGTAIGKELLELCSAAYVAIKKEIPDVKMVMACGPRLERETVNAAEGVDVRGYIPELYKHFAASDLVITQGGGTTTIELTVLKVPFLYFPIEGHPEQPTFVSHALANYQAGYKMIYSETTAESLAEAILSRISKPVAYKKVNADGARKAAQYLYSFLER